MGSPRIRRCAVEGRSGDDTHRTAHASYLSMGAGRQDPTVVTSRGEAGRPDRLAASSGFPDTPVQEGDVGLGRSGRLVTPPRFMCPTSSGRYNRRVHLVGSRRSAGDSFMRSRSAALAVALLLATALVGSSGCIANRLGQRDEPGEHAARAALPAGARQPGAVRRQPVGAAVARELPRGDDAGHRLGQRGGGRGPRPAGQDAAAALRLADRRRPVGHDPGDRRDRAPAAARRLSPRPWLARDARAGVPQRAGPRAEEPAPLDRRSARRIRAVLRVRSRGVRSYAEFDAKVTTTNDDEVCNGPEALASAARPWRGTSAASST